MQEVKKKPVFTRPKTFAEKLGARRPGVTYALSPTLKKKIRETKDPLEKSMLANSGWRGEESLISQQESIKTRHTAYLQEINDRKAEMLAENNRKRMERSASMRLGSSVGAPIGKVEPVKVPTHMQTQIPKQPSVEEIPIGRVEPVKLPTQMPAQVQAKKPPSVVRQLFPTPIVPPVLTDVPAMSVAPPSAQHASKFDGFFPDPVHPAMKVAPMAPISHSSSQVGGKYNGFDGFKSDPIVPAMMNAPVVPVAQPSAQVSSKYDGFAHAPIVPAMKIAPMAPASQSDVVTHLDSKYNGFVSVPISPVAPVQSSTHIAGDIEGIFTSMAGNCSKGDLEQFSQIIGSLADAYRRLDNFIKAKK